MANELKEGTVTINLPPDLPIPPEAGTLSPADAARLPKARNGLGLTCEMTAGAMAKKGAEFPVPGVTAAELSAAGAQAEAIDQVIQDLETLLAKLKQANFLLDAKAIELLRRVNKQVNAQGSFDANLYERFAAVGAYFGKK